MAVLNETEVLYLNGDSVSDHENNVISQLSVIEQAVLYGGDFGKFDIKNRVVPATKELIEALTTYPGVEPHQHGPTISRHETPIDLLVDELLHVPSVARGVSARLSQKALSAEHLAMMRRGKLDDTLTFHAEAFEHAGRRVPVSDRMNHIPFHRLVDATRNGVRRQANQVDLDAVCDQLGNGRLSSSTDELAAALADIPLAVGRDGDYALAQGSPRARSLINLAFAFPPTHAAVDELLITDRASTTLIDWIDGQSREGAVPILASIEGDHGLVSYATSQEQPDAATWNSSIVD